MKITKELPRLLYFSALIGVLLTGTFFIGLKAKTIWNGYYLVLIKNDRPAADILTDWQSFTSTIVSDVTTSVAFTRFAQMEQVKISELAQRLDPEDPRLDPYMVSLQKFFTINPDWSLAFIQSHLPALTLKLHIQALSQAKGYTILLPDIDIGEKILYLLLFTIFMVLFILTSRGLRIVKIISALPWAFSAFLSGTLYDLLCLVIIFPFWFQWVEALLIFCEDWFLYNWRSPSVPLLKGINFILALFLILGLALKIPALTFPVLPLLQNGLIAAGYIGIIIYYRRKQQHKFFRYIPLKGVPVINAGNHLFILGIILVIAAIPIYYTASSGAANLYIPVPGETQIVSSFKDLPNYTGFLAHIQYQENIARGMPYKREKVESVHFDTYSVDSSLVILKDTQTVSYGKVWEKKVKESLQHNSVEKMLLAQGSIHNIGVISLNELAKQRYYYGPGAMLLLIILIPLYIFYLYSSPWLIKRIKSQIFIRKLKTA